MKSTPPPGKAPTIDSRRTEDEIVELDTALCDVTRGRGIKLGSVAKLASGNLGRWGIDLTDENRRFVYGRSQQFYDRDTQERIDYEFSAGTDIPSHTIDRIELETSMARTMGQLVNEILLTLVEGKETLKVLDLVARHGHLTVQTTIHAQMDDRMTELHRNVEFLLLDTSAKRLRDAERILNSTQNRYETTTEKDEVFLKNSADGSFDVVMSLGHFHNKAFLGDYLRELKRVIVPGGALVVGDFYSNLWRSPYLVRNLLRGLALEDKRLGLFEEIMKGYCKQPSNSGITNSELVAGDTHLQDWIETAKNLGTISRTARPPLYLLKGHRTSREMVDELTHAGFEIDKGKLSSAFPKMRSEPLRRITSGSDFAVVMVAKR